MIDFNVLFFFSSLKFILSFGPGINCIVSNVHRYPKGKCYSFTKQEILFKFSNEIFENHTSFIHLENMFRIITKKKQI